MRRAEHDGVVSTMSEPPSAFTSQAKVTTADPTKRAEAATASPRATPLAATAEAEATEGDKHRPAAKADEGAARRQRAPRGPLEEARADATDVLDGWLFLGGQRAAASRKALQDLGVTHVLNCCSRIRSALSASRKWFSLSQTLSTNHSVSS